MANRWLVAVALALAGFGAAAQETHFGVTGFHVEGDNPLSPGATQALLAPYAGEGVTLDRLQAAASALENELKEQGYAFLRVVLPPQDARGVITLRVLASKLGAVNVSGNQYFDTANIRASPPPLVSGESPNLREIARAQALANDHPAKQVGVTIRQGTRPDTVDADVQVEDGSPQQFFAMLDNTGTQESGRLRLGVGYQHANLFGRDHSLVATYTTSPGHAGDVQQYGMYYRAPFYAQGGTVSAYFTRSDSNSGTVAEFFQVSGRGDFAGLRLSHRLLPLGSYSHLAELGVEDRFFINNVSFSGQPIGVDVRSRPLLARYEGRWDGAGYDVRHSAELAYNLRGGSDNDDAAYAANRAGARRDWQAWRFMLEGSAFLGGWSATARLRVQQSGDALIPGEEFALGGAHAVRGLREREVNGDSGYIANLEALTPELAEGLRAVAFLDGGAVRVHDASAGQSVQQGSASVGAGLRWRVGRNASVVFDCAHVLDGGPVTPAGRNFGHFGIVVRY